MDEKIIKLKTILEDWIKEGESGVKGLEWSTRGYLYWGVTKNTLENVIKEINKLTKE